MSMLSKKQTYGLVWITLACLFALACWLVSEIFPSRVRVESLGREGLPALTFADLAKVQPFVASVESKRLGKRGPLHDNVTGRPIEGSTATPYVLVDLAKPNGEKLGIYEENPSTNELAFFSSLAEGQKYRFPDVLIQWEREHGPLRRSESRPLP